MRYRQRCALRKQRARMSPHDTPASATLRFLVEIVAWVAGPWSAAALSGTWWPAIIIAIVLIGLPSVFSTPGDKRQVIIATPGAIRIGIELLLMATAVFGAWIVWPSWAVGAVVIFVFAALLTGARRYLWLLRGAAIPD